VRANDVCARCGFVDAERVCLVRVMKVTGGRSVRVGGMEVEWCVEWDCHTCTVHALRGRVGLRIDLPKWERYDQPH